MAGDPRPKTPREKRRGSKAEFSEGVKEEIRRRSGGRCEVRAPICSGMATVFHHVRRRSQGGKGTAANGLHSCNWCHVYLHDHTGEAYERGWLVRSGS